ncbi:MAG: YceK/YidQ family lipoprotein, partial [Candidatus Scalindua sp.]
MGLFNYLDLPLSVIADTLLLPYTIPKQRKSGNLVESCPDVTPSYSYLLQGSAVCQLHWHALFPLV